MCSRIDVTDECEMPVGIPVRFEHVAGFVELEDAAVVEPGRQPFVDRHLLDHAAPEAGLPHRQIERGRADADQRQPVIAVRGAVDVVRMARHFVDEDLGRAAARTGEPVAIDPAVRWSRRPAPSGRRGRRKRRSGK